MSRIGSLFSTIGSALELVAFVWAGFRARSALRRYRKRVATIRSLTRESEGQTEEWRAEQREARGIPFDDVQYGDMPYQPTFIAAQIAEDEARALLGPGVLAAIGLAISLAGNAVSI